MNGCKNQSAAASVGKSPAMLISVAIKELQLSGYYDESTNTWSDRNFEAASQKKHNEDM